MVSETSLPINQEVVGLPTKAGISCRDLNQQKIVMSTHVIIHICRALFLGVGCLQSTFSPPQCYECYA